MEERVAKVKARAKVLSTFSDVSLQRFKKEDQQLLTGEDNSKNNKSLLLRKESIIEKNENKTEDQKLSHQSRLNYDCKEFIPGKKYFSDLSQSSNHVSNKYYQSDGEVHKMLCKLTQQQSALEVDIDTFSGDITISWRCLRKW